MKKFSDIPFNNSSTKGHVGISWIPTSEIRINPLLNYDLTPKSIIRGTLLETLDDSG